MDQTLTAPPAQDDLKAMLARSVPLKSPTLLDYAKTLASGVGAAASGIGEGIKQGSQLLGVPEGEEIGKGIRSLGDNASDYWNNTLTPGGKFSLTAPVIKDDLSFGPTPIASTVLSTLQSIPSNLVMAVPGTKATRALEGVGAGEAIEKGLGNLGVNADRAKWIGEHAPSSIGMAASEGVFSGLQNAAQTAQEIDQLPQDKLQASPFYQSAYAATDPTLPEQERRQQALEKVKDSAEKEIIARTIPLTGGISAATGGGILGQMARKARKSVIKEILGGIIPEAAQEFGQSGEEQLVQNLAMRNYADPTQSIGDGVLNSSVEGGLSGALLALLGGSVHGLTARNANHVVQPGQPGADTGISQPVNTPDGNQPGPVLTATPVVTPATMPENTPPVNTPEAAEVTPEATATTVASTVSPEATPSIESSTATPEATTSTAPIQTEPYQYKNIPSLNQATVGENIPAQPEQPQNTMGVMTRAAMASGALSAPWTVASNKQLSQQGTLTQPALPRPVLPQDEDNGATGQQTPTLATDSGGSAGNISQQGLPDAMVQPAVDGNGVGGTTGRSVAGSGTAESSGITADNAANPVANQTSAQNTIAPVQHPQTAIKQENQPVINHTEPITPTPQQQGAPDAVIKTASQSAGEQAPINTPKPETPYKSRDAAKMAEEADKPFAEPAENKEYGNDQQRTAQETRENDAGGIADNGTAGAQETGGKAFGLAGQTNEEINAAAQAEHEAEIAKIKAERDAANKRATANQSEFEKIGMVRSGDSWRWKGNVDGDAYDSVTVRPWKGGFTVTTGGYFNSPFGGNALPTKEIGTFKTESEAVSVAKALIASKQDKKEGHAGQPSIPETENNNTHTEPSTPESENVNTAQEPGKSAEEPYKDTKSDQSANKESQNANSVQTKPVSQRASDEDQSYVANGHRDRQPLGAGLAEHSQGLDHNRGVSGGTQGAGTRGNQGETGARTEPSIELGEGRGVRPESEPASGVNRHDAPTEEGTDHVIDADEIGKGGLGKKFRDNVAAIKILKTLETEGRDATPEERKALSKYVGWGAMKGAFDPNNKAWAKQHNELKELLTDEEFRAARASTLDAHYTSPEVVKGMYDALARLGFKSGRVLEPSVGVGNFFGLMPREMRNASQLYGVELDSLTSRLVSALYPKAKIAEATGFQDFEIPSEYFDVVIGNPPFGSYPLVDKERSPYSGFSIHNYFLAKSIDKLRPGGIMAVVVSHNFLDAQDTRVRKWIGERAGLIGGVRLPNTAFKDNAGTEVVTDILIFQKHDNNGFPDSIAPWQDVVEQININPKTGEHVTHNVNQFFVANQQYVLGKPSAGGSMYSANEYTVEQDGDLKNELAKWAKSLPENMFDNIDRASDAAVVDMAVPDGIKVGSYYVDADDKVMQRGNDLMGNKTAVAWEPRYESQIGRMKGMIAIRDALRKQMRLERSVDATEQDIEANRAELNRLYDDFLKKYKHLNSTTNRSIFLDDPESHLIQALEFDYDKGIGKATAEKEGIEQREASATKADIFKRRVAFPPQDHMTVTTAKDALLASLNYRGKVDPDYMAEVYGKPMDEIVKELGDVVFDDPQNGIVTADEYLSGDVKTKLDEAKYAAQGNDKYRRNVEALEKIVPKDKTPSEISVSIGAEFVPADVYEQFAKHISGGSATASYIKSTGQWLMAFDNGNDPALNSGRFGTSDMSAQELFQLTMMGRGAVVKKTLRNHDGSTTTILLEDKTEAAREKQNAIKAEWQKWLWQDPERADRIASIYNDKMNRIVERKYDGSHMSFPGMNPSYSLLAHQKNGVWRGLQTYQVLYDHVVGAGKTFEMVTLAMEMRRLGIARKPLIVVPNHLTLQWRSDFTRLYPGSNILAAAPEDFSKDNRERLFAKITTGDWDAVVVGHSSLKKIGLPEKTEIAVLQEQVDELADAIEDMKRARGDKRITADMERIRKNLDAKMKDKLSALGKRSKMVTFDELGVDAMFIDEMHEFKNLAYNTTMDRNPGMGNPAGSAKAFDLFVKTRWMFDTFGDKTPFISATGTPISNSLVEMFNMQRYMQYPTLKRLGLNVFDAWARQFGSVENVYEVAPSGSGYRQSTRFSKFTNLPALMSLYNTFADTVTLDDLKAQEEAQGNRFPVPKMVGGRPVLVVAERSPYVAALMGMPKAQTDESGNILFNANLDDDIQIKQDEKSGKWTARVGDKYLGLYDTAEDARLKVVESALTPSVSVDPDSILGRFGRLRQLTKETKGKVNALSLTGEANKAGLDYRLIDPKAPDFPGSKINLAVDNMMRIYKQWDADKGTQLVFCDLSIPLSARSSYSNKSRRLYVRDDAGGIEMKRGTMHAIPGYEDLPFFVVQRGDKESKRFDVYDAASGQGLKSDFRSKQDAIDATSGLLGDEAKRQKWINARESTGEIEQSEIDEYNNENDIDVDDPSLFFTRDDVAGISGAANFSVYDDIKSKLMDKGVPENEIAFIHDYNTPTAKDKLFKAVNHGSVRFLLGSTPKMGAGTNVQERLVGLHHIDAPWRPSDLEQREGRIIRRGNKLYERDPENFEVFIGRYATAQTYDTRRWQILEHKARGIEQLRNYDGTLNEIDDIEGEAANAADMKAAASGDPLILEETKLRTDVRRLENLQAAYADEVLAMTRKARSAQEYADTSGPAFVREIRKNLETIAKHPVDKDGFSPISVQGGKALTDKDSANKALASVFENVRSHMIDKASIQYRGLAFELEYVAGNVIMRTPTGMGGMWGATDQFSPSGMVQRLKNYIDRLPAMLDDTLASIEKSKKDSASMRELAKQPFPQAADLERAREDYKKVQRALMAKGPEVPVEQKVAVVSGIEQQKAKLRELGFGDALDESTKYSRSATLTRNPHTESTLREAINSAFQGTKNFADALIATRKFHIIGSEDIGKYLGEGKNFSKASQTDTFNQTNPDIRYSKDGRILAFVRNGETFFVHDNISQTGDSVKGLLLHELGDHALMLGRSDAEFKKILRQFKMMGKAGNEKVIEAQARVPEGTPAHLVDEESLGYFLEANPDLTFSQRVIAWFRDALRKLGDKLKGIQKLQWVQWANRLNESDIVYMATQATRNAPTALQNAQNNADINTRFSKSSIIGASGRAYTPEQLAAMERTGSVVTKKTIQETVKSLWQDAGKKLAQGVFDQFRPVRDLSSHAYTLMRLSSGASGAFEAFMRHGKLLLRDGAYDADTSGGALEKVFYPLGKESTDFLRWVAGNRAERLAKEDRENLFTLDDINAFKSLANGDTDFDYTMPNGNVTRKRILIYRDSLRKFNEFNKNVLDMAEQSGLIDPESRHLWEHEFYVPFYRTVDENDGGIRGMNIKQGVVRQEAFKKLKGGDEKLNDLLANTLMNWAHLIDASAKNRAATATLQAAVKVGAARLALPGDKKTVWHMSGGKKVEYKVDDPYLLDAINGLEYAGLRGPAMDAMSTMKHWLTVGVTASPFFKVRNLIRDSIQSIATADMGYNPLSNVMKGYKLTDRAAQEYVSALAGGGLIRFGTMLEGNEASRVRQLIKNGASDQHILDNESKVRAFYDKYAEPLISAYEELGNRGEEINRMALYDSLIRKGVDHATASLMARDLMDFSMRGTWKTIRFLTQIVPFMNARLQGLYKLGRAAKEDPARFAIVIGGVALASLALLAAYGDDDDWKKREDWDRDNYWWFKIGDEAFRIPKPFEIGAISNLAERTAELAFDDEMTFKRFSGVVLNNIDNQLSMNPVPQLFKPIIDVYANHDSFTERPIETMGMERLAPDYRFNQNTSMIGRGISTAGNTITGDHFLSPVQVDHLIRSYFGWLGAFAVGTADIAVRSASNEPTRPALDYWKTITGSMVSELDGAPSRYVTMMYDQAREIEQAYATWHELMKEGKQEEAAAYRDEHQDELSKYRRVEAIKRQETMLNNRIKFIERSDIMDADEKKERINALRQQQDQIARRLSP
jgi:N12 class adenine-specific DNA methylase